ncbi:Alg9-like mannosyltransferase family-domain-containing protein [Jimgerdemannia flammicorona]|uniref:Mannosyltransferase n=1 Tax=Jimgerdemannia flammicorona TaxID=994334 RepID=A0A433QZ66_9FUNG|nr:Alg9-like mannosyltransferase family-domain-containing protein [Jimgerdemannia flammicorona]
MLCTHVWVSDMGMAVANTKLRPSAHIRRFVQAARGHFKLDDQALAIRWICIFLAPHLLQAVFAGVGDYYTCRFAQKAVGMWISPTILFSTLTSWFNLHTAVRPLSNSLETVLTVVALFYWPLPGVVAEIDPRWQSGLRVALVWAAVSCVIRPTNGVVWLFLGVHLLWRCPNRQLSIMINTAIVMVLAFGTVLTLDTYLYTGSFSALLTAPIIAPLNFLRVNVFNSISLFYGIHSWHWYLTQGLPVLLTTFLPLFISGLWLSYADPALRTRTIPLLYLLAFVISVYSLLPHKEFRFIYPLLPILLLFASIGLHNLSPKHKWLAMVALVMTNIPMALYTSIWHQRGVVDVMRWVRERAQPGMEVEFLMPCHSTPWYSEVHDKEVNLEFLGCEPPLDPTDPTYMDEADVFYANPRRFILDRFNRSSVQGRAWPTHLVMFEALLKMEDEDGSLRGLFLGKGENGEGIYRECARFFNTHFNGDWRRKGDVIVLCYNDTGEDFVHIA